MKSSFPVTVGPDLTRDAGYDAFIAKLNPSGTGLVYCGYIGGSGTDYGRGIAVDAAGNAYVAGETTSTETSFPVTLGPDLAYGGGNYDGFVAKVNTSGTSLVYCGYIGGEFEDHAFAIAVDGTGNAYLAGDTASTEATFPVSVGPDTTYNGGATDVFVAKVNAVGTGFGYCGYISGAQDDHGYAIAVDAGGSAYVTGKADSFTATFPVAVGPDLTFNGGCDAFVAKVSASGSGLVYCGYVGGASNDYGCGIDVDAAGNAYIVGYTRSTESNFPVAVGPDLIYNGGNWDGFVVKVKADGTGLAYGGYIGGSGDDYGYGIDVDSTGTASIAGFTSSTETTFPVAGGPDLTYNGLTRDAFVAKVKASGQGLAFCGYVGGSGDELAYGAAVDASGNIYVAGGTPSTESTFPVTVGPDLTFNGGSFDGFVAKVTGPPLWEARHAAGDFDGDGADELAVDFGATGAWLWNSGAWTQLTASNPESLITGKQEQNKPDIIFADLGSLGVWVWNGGVWTQLSGVNAEGLAVGDVNGDGSDEATGDFGAAGLWIWSGGAWTQLSGVNAEYAAMADLGGDGTMSVVGDFGATGLWKWEPGFWYQLGGVNADFVTFGDLNDDGTNEVLGDFGALGLWHWDSGLWTQYSGVNADYILAADTVASAGEEVVGDFGPTGLWLWTGGVWSILSGLNAEYFVWTDVDGNWIDELAVDFGALGLWFWDAGAWTQISGVDPDCLMIADTDSDDKYELLADFGMLGLWVWNDAVWTQISPNNPE